MLSPSQAMSETLDIGSCRAMELKTFLSQSHPVDKILRSSDTLKASQEVWCMPSALGYWKQIFPNVIPMKRQIWDNHRSRRWCVFSGANQTIRSGKTLQLCPRGRSWPDLFTYSEFNRTWKWSSPSKHRRKVETIILALIQYNCFNLQLRGGFRGRDLEIERKDLCWTFTAAQLRSVFLV